jgi:hypothetical protein
MRYSTPPFLLAFLLCLLLFYPREACCLSVLTIQRLLPRICQPGAHFKSVRFENEAVKSSFGPTPPVEIKNGSIHWKTYWLLHSCCDQCRNPSAVKLGPCQANGRCLDPSHVSSLLVFVWDDQDQAFPRRRVPWRLLATLLLSISTVAS